MPYQHQIETLAATIASGASLSDAVEAGGRALVGVVTPAAWTAAALTFLFSADGIGYYPVYDRNAEVTVASGVIAAAEARWIALDPTLFAGATHLKVRSGVNGAAVNQAAERVVTLVFKPI